jgi:uncharacterized protein YrzB (UPF0473 family)
LDTLCTTESIKKFFNQIPDTKKFINYKNRKHGYSKSFYSDMKKFLDKYTTEKNKTFTAYRHGKNILFRVLFTFKDNIFKKSYVVFTDNSLDPKTEELLISAATYNGDCNGEIMEIYPIETVEEWNMIEAKIKSLGEK